jgi:hypothetical protein
MEMGPPPPDGMLKLEPYYCGKQIALDFDTARRYRFFGNDERFFETYEDVGR